MFYIFFNLRLWLRPTAKDRSFSEPNIRLRPKVKIAPTVQQGGGGIDTTEEEESFQIVQLYVQFEILTGLFKPDVHIADRNKLSTLLFSKSQYFCLLKNPTF